MFEGLRFQGIGALGFRVLGLILDFRVVLGGLLVAPSCKPSLKLRALGSRLNTKLLSLWIEGSGH